MSNLAALKCSNPVTLPTANAFSVLPKRQHFYGQNLQRIVDIETKYRVYRLCCRASMDDDNSLPVLDEDTKSQVKKSEHQCGLAEAARYARKDAMLMSAAAQNIDERARSDLILLAREFSRLDMQARQNMALIGSKVLKLDERARDRTERKVGRFGRIATKLKEIAGTELKTAATEHWNDGALEADLRLADLRARRRAMEDSYATLQAVKSIHNAAVKVLRMKEAKSQSSEFNAGMQITKDARPAERTPSVLDRIAEFEDEYLSMASLLTEADVLEQSDPDELEFIVATLLDMDEVDGASGASLVTESSSSPNTATRRALVDALADAPSLWTLGNSGISALQRLAQDENPEVSAAASKALEELARQWKHLDVNMLSTNFDSGNYSDGDPNEE